MRKITFLLLLFTVFLLNISTYSQNFITTPATKVQENKEYSYVIYTDNSNVRTLTVTATTIPSWLTLQKTDRVNTYAGGLGGYRNGQRSYAEFQTPSGVAVDTHGNLYVADTWNHRIRKITPAGVTTFAGDGTEGHADGTGIGAKFNRPIAIAIGPNRNLYVVDTDSKIRKITPARVVTTLNGTYNRPRGIAVDANGNVYVADTYNSRIQKITPGGGVTTFAGGIGGYADGTGTNARFSVPNGVVVAVDGNIYVADSGNVRIRKITPAGVVTTFAGGGPSGSYADAIGTNANFNSLYTISTDASGNLYTGSTVNLIRKITPAGVVTTFAGSGTNGGYTNGLRANARFSFPTGIAVATDGSVYVADAGNNRIRKILPDVVLKGTPTTAERGDHNVVLEVSDGQGGTATQNFTITVTEIIPPVFDNPPSATNILSTGFTLNTDIDEAGTVYYVVLQKGAARPTSANVRAGGTNAIRNGSATTTGPNFINTIAVTGLTANTPYDIYVVAEDDEGTPNIQANPTTVSFKPSGYPPAFDNPPSATNLLPTGFTLNTDIDEAGTVYYVVLQNGAAAPTSANVKAGGTSAISSGSAIATGPDFINTIAVTGLTTRTAYDVYVVAEDNESPPNIQTNPTIVRLTTQTTLRFTSTPLITVKENTEYSYVIHKDNNNVRPLTVTATTEPSWLTLEKPDNVSTFAGSTYGFNDGTGTNAQFYSPFGVALDTHGNVYVADGSNNRIRKITPAGVVTTFAGSAIGFVNGTGTRAKFNDPRAVAVGPNGNVYVADTGNHRIRKITPEGVVTTLSGTYNKPRGVAVDANGNVYVADTWNNRIRKITPAGVTNFAGDGTASYADGIGTNAKFNKPYGVVVAADGNIYVIDTWNNRIRKITPAGVVTTFAGDGTEATRNGIGTDAQFKPNYSISTDASGNLYTGGLDRIRKITPGGLVTTFAGSGTSGGFANGPRANAQFYFAVGIAVATDGSVYVGDQSNHKIRKILPDLVLKGTPTITERGDHNVVLEVSDGQGGTATQTFTITVTDGTPPVFDSTPSASNILRTGFTLNTDINEAGKVYYVVLQDGAAVPTSANVKAGEGFGGTTATSKGSATATGPDFINTIAVTGLTANTAYDVYVVAEDDEGSPNIQANPTIVNITTPKNPPTFDVAPSATNILATSFTLNTDINKAGTVYYVVLQNGAAAPTSANVKAGGTNAISNGSATATGSDFINTIAVTGLTANTAYNVYIVAEDDEGSPNIQANPTIVNIATRKTPPVFDVPPSATSILTTSFTLNTDIDQAGTMYYVVLLDGETAPTSANVKAGEGSGGTTATSKGSATATGSDFINTIAVTGLTANTAYDVYVAAEDDEGTPNFENPTIVKLTTRKNPPTFDVAPSATNILRTGFTLNTDIDQAGTMYYVVLLDGETAPTSANVKAGEGFGGTTATSKGSATATGSDFINTIAVTGLTANTAYDVYVVAEDNESPPNIQANPTTVNITTLKNPPTFDVPPSATNILATSFTLNTDINEAGTVYYVVLLDGETAPTSANVKAGKKFGGTNNAISSGSATATGSDFINTIAVTGLTANTAYDVYIVAEDNEGTPNIQANPTTVKLTTRKNPPTFDVAPSASNILRTGFTLNTDINKAGTVYYVVLLDGVTAPTSANVKAGGTNAIRSGSATATGSDFINTIAVTGLTANTAYDVYVVAEDDEGSPNIQANPTIVNITTRKNPPAFDVAPSASNILRTGFTLNTDINEAGTVYYVVLLDGETAPTSANVKAGKKFGGTNNAISSGSATATGSDFINTIAVTGLTANTAYDVYVVAEDNESPQNIQANPTTVKLTTRKNPPTFDVAPSASNILRTGFTLNTDINKAGTVYYVVLLDGVTAPTSANVKAGGTNAIRSGSATATGSDFINTIAVTGLTANTAYDVYVVAEDDEGSPNIQANPTIVNITTRKNPPAFDVAPSASNILRTGFTLNTDINEAGTVYYVVLLDGETAPTSANVKAGKKFGGTNNAISSGSATATGPDFINTIAVTGLTENTAYDVYIVAEDNESPPNIQANPTTVSFNPPTFDVAPSATNILRTGFTLNTDINKAGTVYYVVLLDGVTAPTSANVKAGEGSGGTIATSNGSATATGSDFINTIAVTGLAANTAYDVYVVVEDDESPPNIQANPTIVNITTLKNPPTFDVAPSATNILLTGFTLNTDINKAGTVYYVVLLDGETAPTSANVKAGKKFGGTNNAISSGSATATGPNFINTIAVTGLTANTAYDVYIVAEDNESPPNIQANPTIVKLTTLPNAPVITAISGYTCSENRAVTEDNILIITGTAEANSTVVLYNNSVLIGTFSVDASGNWTYDYSSVPLDDGVYVFTATSTGTADNISNESEEFSITVNTSDNDGCEKTVVIKEKYGISPNGDGVNDRWVIENIELSPDNIARVYNRSGKLVFEQKGYNNTWEGFSNKINNSKKLPVGAYYFIVELLSPPKARIAKGWLYINY